MQFAQRRREARRLARQNQNMGLNLTPLIDIFTLLVCFLLVGFQGDVSIPSIKGLSLPVSTSFDVPTNALTLVVTSKTIRANEKDLQPMGTGDYSVLSYYLNQAAATHHVAQVINGVGERPLILLADRTIPYSELSKIMAVASQAHFGLISLAVNKEARARG